MSLENKLEQATGAIKEGFGKVTGDSKTELEGAVEKTDFARTKMTLSNYFYKVKNQYPLTEKQQELYAILGDVNPEYALKYMTTFLLKFLKKDQLMQKRRDIFVDSLVVLGYIVQNEDGKYELAVDFDKESLSFYLA